MPTSRPEGRATSARPPDANTPPADDNRKHSPVRRRATAAAAPVPAASAGVTEAPKRDRAAGQTSSATAAAAPTTDDTASEAAGTPEPSTAVRSTGAVDPGAETADAVGETPADAGAGNRRIRLDRAAIGRGARGVAGAFGRGLRRNAAPLVSTVVAAAVLLAAVALGPVDSSNGILVGLGFDPDRAQLLTALIVGGAVSVIACLCGGVRWAAVPLGFAAMAALFASTLTRETQDAMSATGATGTFAPAGWAQTLLAFVVIGLVTAWACATCAIPVRGALALTVSSTVAAAKERPLRRRSWNRPVAALLVLGLLALTLPLAADMFNYGADERMTAGGPPRQGLVPEDQVLPGDALPSFDASIGVPDEPSLLPGDSATPDPTGTLGPIGTPGGSPSTGPGSGSPAPTVRPTLSLRPPASLPPWRESPPAGAGRVLYLGFNGPWVDAGDATEEVAVYLPPGYDTNTTQRYPAVYEAPFLYNVWNSALHVKSTLDALINDGQIPPSLFLFMNAGGGPFGDTQCADTYDGREKMDQFMGVTVPAYIDKHYRTIATPAARAVMGMSEGGYCAAILALHHPDVFGTAISFSGYFTAGLGSASAPIPFGNNPTLIANDSPSYVAPRLSGEAQLGLYFVIVAQASQAFYGTQATGFMSILDKTAIDYKFINSDQPHGWPQVRDSFSDALTLVALRQARLGVFH